MSQTVNIEIPFTDEDIDLHIMGSGFTMYEWWHNIVSRPTPHNGYLISAINPDNEDAVIQKYVPFDRIRKSVGAIMRQYPDACIEYLGDDWDIDANGADLIMQHAMFGEVIYG